MNISDIAAAVATRKCALFAGAGLTADSGGSTWDELVNSIKNKLTYTSPLKDNFQIMGDMCEKYGRVGQWASAHRPLIKPCVGFSPTRLSDDLLSYAFE